MIVQNGQTLLEKYFAGYDAQSLNVVASVTKTFTGAALGVCMDQGWIPSLDTPVLDYFTEYDDEYSYDVLNDIINL